MANKKTWSGALPSQDDAAALSSLLTARTARTIVVVSGPEVGARSLLLYFSTSKSMDLESSRKGRHQKRSLL